MLSIEGLHAGYDGTEVLSGVTLTVERGQVTTLLGDNGAGKTTLLRTVVGTLAPSAGTITFEGTELRNHDPPAAFARGITLVPEDRGVFPNLTVAETLRVPEVEHEFLSPSDVYETFPTLDGLQETKGAQLSGGEQQVLAIARALRSEPTLLVLDEPSEGLAPAAVASLVSVIDRFVARGGTVLLVEQHTDLVVDVAHRGYVLADGHVVDSGPPAALLSGVGGPDYDGDAARD